MRWKSVADRHMAGGSQPIEQCRDSDSDIYTTTLFLAHFQVDFQEANWITVWCVCCVVSQWAMDTADHRRWPAVCVWSLCLVTLHVVECYDDGDIDTGWCCRDDTGVVLSVEDMSGWRVDMLTNEDRMEGDLREWDREDIPAELKKVSMLSLSVSLFKQHPVC